MIEDLRTAIIEYRKTVEQRMELQEVEKDQKALVMSLMHKFEDELTVDEKTGTKSFQAEMVIAELALEEKEVLHTRKA